MPLLWPAPSHQDQVDLLDADGLPFHRLDIDLNVFHNAGAPHLR